MLPKQFMIKYSKWTLLLISPIFIWVSHYLGVFAHEYSHSVVAWLLGFKDNPWIINFGGTSILNLITLINIDEHVNYDQIFSQGKGWQVALIAASGMGIGNGVLYVISLFLLKKEKIQRRNYLYYFLFWINFISLANFYCYIPIRTFGSHGDMANIAKGLQVSPWLLYALLGYIVIFLMWVFFAKTIVEAYASLNLNTILSRAILLITCVIILFGYFGMAGFIEYGEISHFLSATSFLVIPGIIIACWPMVSDPKGSGRHEV